jgi:hypothetical protein
MPVKLRCQRFDTSDGEDLKGGVCWSALAEAFGRRVALEAGCWLFVPVPDPAVHR